MPETSWSPAPEAEGFYWWQRHPTASLEVVHVIRYEGDDVLQVLPFGYDLDRRMELAELLDWHREGRFWGPLTPPAT